jgi:predicted metal-binding membrane protein
MKMFIPLLVVIAMLTQCMSPIVVLFHNSGTNPQQYDLPLAIGGALFGCCVLLYLMVNQK